MPSTISIVTKPFVLTHRHTVNTGFFLWSHGWSVLAGFTVLSHGLDQILYKGYCLSVNIYIFEAIL